MAKKQQPEPQTMNAAPNFQPPPGYQAPNTGVTAPGGPYGAPATAVTFTPPPPPPPRYPFISATWLWEKFGQQGGGQAKIIGARINNPRTLKNGNTTQPGWNIDLQFQDGTLATGTINIGDIKHQRLFAKFQVNWIGQTILVRLPHPGDQTKATWVVE